MAFAHGAVLTIGSAIANLRTISIDGISVDSIDLSTHGSTNVREFAPGLRDSGTISVTGVHTVATDASQFMTMLNARTVTGSATLAIPGDSSTVTYTMTNVFITEYSAEAPHDAEGAFSATIKVGGTVTVA